MKPIKIYNGKVKVLLNLSHSLYSISLYEIPFRYNGKNKLKSLRASQIIDLRLQFQPFCRFIHNHDDFDPEHNEIIGMGPDSTSSQDMIYEWHFAHRHNFPSDISGSGRGQAVRITDIKQHPLSYILLCNDAHEEYDRENGNWKKCKR